MHIFFSRDNATSLKPGAAEAAYTLTSPGSKLRTYAKNLIIAEGPLRDGILDTANAQRAKGWGELIQRGGDLVYDVVVAEKKSFSQECDPDCCLGSYCDKNQEAYLEKITTRPLEEFLERKPTTGRLER